MGEENENERDGVGVAFEVVEMMIRWFGEAFFSSSSSSVCFVNSEFGDNKQKVRNREIEPMRIEFYYLFILLLYSPSWDKQD